MVRQNNRHRRALEKIIAHPTKFGIEGSVISSAMEKNLFDDDKQIAQPDIIFEMRNGDWHIVEYKGIGNGEMTERARKQLGSVQWWFGKYHPEIRPGQIHTHIISGDDPKYKDLLR